MLPEDHSKKKKREVNWVVVGPIIAAIIGVLGIWGVPLIEDYLEDGVIGPNPTNTTTNPSTTLTLPISGNQPTAIEQFDLVFGDLPSHYIIVDHFDDPFVTHRFWKFNSSPGCNFENDESNIKFSCYHSDPGEFGIIQLSPIDFQYFNTFGSAFLGKVESNIYGGYLGSQLMVFSKNTGDFVFSFISKMYYDYIEIIQFDGDNSQIIGFMEIEPNEYHLLRNEVLDNQIAFFVDDIQIDIGEFSKINRNDFDFDIAILEVKVNEDVNFEDSFKSTIDFVAFIPALGPDCQYTYQIGTISDSTKENKIGRNEGFEYVSWNLENFSDGVLIGNGADVEIDGHDLREDLPINISPDGISFYIPLNDQVRVSKLRLREGEFFIVNPDQAPGAFQLRERHLDCLGIYNYSIIKP